MDLKERINITIGSIQKKVLVFIDDFDRLSREEILEVLKLIDNNAAFPNLCFITAYDKNQVNKYFGETYRTLDACFVDKFFNLEFAIPQRPYSYISKFIEDKLCKKLQVGDLEKKDFEHVLTNRLSLFQIYVPTLRDAKRFINQFVLDYDQVRGDVIIDEFMLVQLVKYRYPEEYKRIYKKEFFLDRRSSKENNFLIDGIHYIKDNLPKDLNILNILEHLFPKQKDSPTDHFRHIFDEKSFENYFVNRIYGTLRIREMDKIFQNETNSVFTLIDSWLEDEKKSNDIMDYLSNQNIYKFKNAQDYMRYAIVVAYMAVKRPQSRAFWLLLNLIKISNVESYCKKYSLTIETYKKSIVEIILNKEYDNNLELLRSLHYRYKTNDLHEEELLIKDNDIWPKIKKQFLYLVNESKDEKNLIKWLYSCIDYMEEPSRKLFLDTDCLKAYREHIIKNPNYYIETFVGLGMISSSPDFNSVGCEPFWEQIFSDESQFEKFLENCTQQKIPGIERVNNFWRLYKANEKKAIEFEGQGNVQEKINSNLANEVEMLKQMQKIKSEVDGIPAPSAELTLEKKEEVLTSLRRLLSELDNIKLHISLREKIKNRIQELLDPYEINVTDD